jgi:CDGSH-type Zn-finger protein
VTEHRPYRVTGDVAIYGAEGDLLRQGGIWHLCRCGGSRNKPFCDITHGLKRFDGSESADHGPIAQRRDSYAADGVTVYDDRTVCCHYGQCTSRLPAVFRAGAEPFINPGGASAAEITGVVGGCPSGALAYARGDDTEPVEPEEHASITATVDGPYRVRGSIPVFGADGRAYQRRARQVLCRCGLSRNKPASTSAYSSTPATTGVCSPSPTRTRAATASS